MHSQGNRIPVGWASVRIGDLYSFEYGKTLVKSSRTENGNFPVYGSSGIVGMHNQSLVKGPSIIVGRKGAAGSVHYSKDDCWPIDTTYFIRDNKHLSHKFSYYLLRSLNLEKLEASTAIPGLNRNHAYDELALLPPLAEQHRIVAKIEELFSELDKGLESLKTAQAQLKVYRQSLLKHAFEGKLTAQWRADNSDKLEPVDALLRRIQQERVQRYQQQLADWEAEGKQGSKPKASKSLSFLTSEELAELPELPMNWTWARLGNTNVDVFDGPFGSNLKSSDYVGSGVRVIRLENIGSLDFIGSKESYITEKKYELLKRHTVAAGDIIFSSFITENIRVALLPSEINKAINKADCFCIRLFGESLENTFVVMFLSTRKVFKRLEEKIHGVGRPRINTTQLKEIAIPVCGLAEQRIMISELDARLSEMNSLEQTITTALKQSEALRQSILKKAFSGQLVTQDASDEPAVTLLARIQAEKAAQSPSKKARK